MKTLEKVSDFVGKYMAAIVIVVAEMCIRDRASSLEERSSFSS